jgi:hypothetical protein
MKSNLSTLGSGDGNIPTIGGNGITKSRMRLVIMATHAPFTQAIASSKLWQIYNHVADLLCSEKNGWGVVAMYHKSIFPIILDIRK